MLKGIKTFFSELLDTDAEIIDALDPKQLAAAALMIEVATIDDHFDATEIQALINELQRQFDIDSETLHQLIDQARRESDDATSLYQFTRCVNDEFSAAEKFELMQGMWRVAFSDGDLDKYEEYIIRRVSDLIYVPHSEFIRAKKVALDR
ncbi:TerB family tellurite resistance protein [Aestuariicella hydrocarbonica]|uniref:TerB family tellurite resistance protein n=1 Tax=Pseudomaricurvus hydrocarbonicus TaxID=1470433 RepID=A0A9E5MJ91_9GAMM|nr:TerB family tellurite resistance protein [Aestuariicella hydrocarbonica]NHO64719.1 TerB family tellurite resistance protein [Aestuariicella hydrocarbonica]